jgi:hypothetical protein
MIPLPTISEAQKIRLDTPYRLLASLLGIASAVVLATGLSRPSQAVEKAANVAGLHLTAQIQTFVGWITAPVRAGVVAGVSGYVLCGALLFLGLWTHNRSGGGNLGSTRAPATAWVAIAAYLEVKGDVFTASWFALLVVIVAWTVREGWRDNGEAPVFAVMELAVALGAAVLMPFFWLMLDGAHRLPTDGARSTASRSQPRGSATDLDDVPSSAGWRPPPRRRSAAR